MNVPKYGIKRIIFRIMRIKNNLFGSSYFCGVKRESSPFHTQFFA